MKSAFIFVLHFTVFDEILSDKHMQFP